MGSTEGYCIYQIVNTINDMPYVGSTIDSEKGRRARWVVHRNDAVNHTHRPLYKAMSEIGIDLFYMQVIEHWDDLSTLSEREQYWIDRLNSLYPDGYNSALASKCIYRTEEDIRKAEGGVNMTGREVLHLAVGEEAAIETGYSTPDYEIVTVKRITPTGRIVVRSGNRELTFYQDGSEVGGAGSIHRRYLVLLTSDVRIAVLRKELAHFKWNNASYATVERVAKIVGLIGEEPEESDALSSEQTL